MVWEMFRPRFLPLKLGSCGEPSHVGTSESNSKNPKIILETLGTWDVHPSKDIENGGNLQKPSPLSCSIFAFWGWCSETDLPNYQQRGHSMGPNFAGASTLMQLNGDFFRDFPYQNSAWSLGWYHIMTPVKNLGLCWDAPPLLICRLSPRIVRQSFRPSWLPRLHPRGGNLHPKGNSRDPPIMGSPHGKLPIQFPYFKGFLWE